MTNGQSSAAIQDDNLLGNFLKDRRTKLDAARLGYAAGRRRTPGLRREEVAQRAEVSTTWYTWLEQGRGGAPSADVLERLARALDLSDVEREHLFLLAQNRPPEVRPHEADSVTPQMQRILDAFEYSPAYIKTPEWDIVAFNRAATVIFSDLMALPQSERNLLRVAFHPQARLRMHHWPSVVRFLVATFRTETARTGMTDHARAIVDELSAQYPEFRQLWLNHDVTAHGEGIKQIAHATLGLIDLEYAAFAIDGKPRLSMVVYNPTTGRDRAGIRALIGEPALR